MVQTETLPNSTTQMLRQTRSEVLRHTQRQPEIGLMLGSGLGALVNSIEPDCEIPYAELPHVPVSTSPGHKGSLIVGSVEGSACMAFNGRFHFYEGHSPEQLAYPVRLMRAMGAETVILTGIVGSMDAGMPPGSLVLVEDHINLMGMNPLIGPNDEVLGPRFTDMSAPYDPELRQLVRQSAQRLSLELHTGVYVGVAGPNLETPAEYRMLRQMGADVVGMSIVPEVIAARHCGLRVLALTVVSDACIPESLQPADVDELLRVAAETEPKLTTLLREVIRGL